MSIFIRISQTTIGMLRQCRYCLEETDLRTNPLIRPCKCKGSSQYVHRTCIQLWRNTTSVQKFVSHCQVCLTPYSLPSLERIPALIEDWRFKILFKIANIMPVTYSIWFFCFFGLHAKPLLLDNSAETSIFCNFFVTNAVTTMYVNYYNPYIEIVVDKHRYILFWMGSHSIRQPALLFCTGMFFVCSVVSFHAFVFFYVVCLQSLLPMHKRILQTMNAN